MIQQTTNNPVRIVQITDTHLYAEAHGTLLKMNTRDSFNHVVKAVKEREPDIDIILATGDIAQDASEQAYRLFMDSMRDFKAPYFWIPGNHDVASEMERIAEGSSATEKLIKVNNWLILLLDTSEVGQVHGSLAVEELEFLNTSLKRYQDDESVEHILITMHHNPTRGNAGWMKDIGLRNAKAFWKFVGLSDKVRCVLYGHVHQSLDFEHEGVRCLCTPSTCIQFKPNVTNFELDKENPGYRNLQLFADGSIETEVYRIVEHDLELDYDSEGY